MYKDAAVSTRILLQYFQLQVKFALERAMKSQRRVEVSLYSFLSLGARWGWVVNATSRPLYNQEKEPVPRRLGGPQGRSKRVRKISSPLGFDPRTAQLVASRYTD